MFGTTRAGTSRVSLASVRARQLHVCGTYTVPTIDARAETLRQTHTHTHSHRQPIISPVTSAHTHTQTHRLLLLFRDLGPHPHTSRAPESFGTPPHTPNSSHSRAHTHTHTYSSACGNILCESSRAASNGKNSGGGGCAYAPRRDPCAQPTIVGGVDVSK